MGTDERDLDAAPGESGEPAAETTGETAGGGSSEPTIAAIMERDVITVHPETGVQELAELMHERRIGGAPVVDGDGRLVGIVTDGDLIAEEADIHFPAHIDILDAIVYLESFHKYEERLRKAVGATVGDVMTTEVHTVHPEDGVRKAATLMRDHKINRVPVVDEDDKLVGLCDAHRHRPQPGALGGRACSRAGNAPSPPSTWGPSGTTSTASPRCCPAAPPSAPWSRRTATGTAPCPRRRRRSAAGASILGVATVDRGRGAARGRPHSARHHLRATHRR